MDNLARLWGGTIGLALEGCPAIPTWEAGNWLSGNTLIQRDAIWLALAGGTAELRLTAAHQRKRYGSGRASPFYLESPAI